MRLIKSILLGFGLAHLTLALLNSLFMWFGMLKTDLIFWMMVGVLTIIYTGYTYDELRRRNPPDKES